jgi:hypothetical protein
MTRRWGTLPSILPRNVPRWYHRDVHYPHQPPPPGHPPRTFERNRSSAGRCFLLGVCLACGMALVTHAQDKQSEAAICGKSPKLIFQPKLSAEDVARLKSNRLVGRVALVVNENGNATDVRVLSASPKDGGQILFDAVMTAKFAPRPGCKPLNVEFFFELKNR